MLSLSKELIEACKRNDLDKLKEILHNPNLSTFNIDFAVYN